VVGQEGQVFAATPVGAGRTKLKASESGAVTPAVYRDNTPIDPHNMFVATIASAHMLTWLHMAFSLDVEVERYVDRAYGVLTGLESGDRWISEVILNPKITLKAGYEMTEATMAHLHEHVRSTVTSPARSRRR